MSLNPEFRRHLWLDLSFHRLWITPMILGGVFYLFSLTGKGPDSDNGIIVTALTLFFLVPVIWGSYLVENSLVSEVQGGTWTTQRLTSLSPWSMTWGKLLGGPIFAWYIGLLSLVVLAFTATTTESTELPHLLPGQTLWYSVGLMIGLALGSNALGLISAFAYLQDRAKSKRKSGIAVIPPIILTIIFLSTLTGSRVSESIEWFGTTYGFAGFMLVAIYLHVAWAVAGAWMQMRKELQIANHPIVWVGFVAFLVVFYMGLHNPSDNSANLPAESYLLHRAMIAFGITLALTYMMMFYESTRGTDLRRWFLLLEQNNITKAIRETPRWAVTVLLTLTAGIGLVAVYSSMPEKPEADIYGITGAMFLFMVRDVGIYYYFHFSSKSTRALASTLVTYLVLYLLIPSIINGLDIESLIPIFWPVPGVNTLFNLLPPLLQAGAVGWLTAKRWQKNFYTNATS